MSTTVDELIGAAKLARDNARYSRSLAKRWEAENRDFSRQYAEQAHGDFDRAYWYIWRAKILRDGRGV